MKRAILIYILLLQGCWVVAQQAELRDSIFAEMNDTLEAVEVTADTASVTRTPYWKKLWRQNPHAIPIPPSVLDKMLHPFAIKQRKQERHRRKMRRILREYERVRTNDELLREALIKEGIDPDSLLMQRLKRDNP